MTMWSKKSLEPTAVGRPSSAVAGLRHTSAVAQFHTLGPLDHIYAQNHQITDTHPGCRHSTQDIEEFIGRVTSDTTALSLARMVSPRVGASQARCQNS